MNFLKGLINKTRATMETRDGSDAWHTYEHPPTGNRMRVYNLSSKKMPLEMLVNGEPWAHIAPFDGELEPGVRFKAGDYVFRALNLRERSALVETRLRQIKKENKGSRAILKPDGELRRMLNVMIAKECAVVQMQDLE